MKHNFTFASNCLNYRHEAVNFCKSCWLSVFTIRRELCHDFRCTLNIQDSVKDSWWPNILTHGGNICFDEGSVFQAVQWMPWFFSSDVLDYLLDDPKWLSPSEISVCILVLWFHFPAIDEIVNRKQSAFYRYEVVVFKGEAYMQISFVNKIFIISGNTVFGCALKYAVHELVYRKTSQVSVYFQNQVLK